METSHEIVTFFWYNQMYIRNLSVSAVEAKSAEGGQGIPKKAEIHDD